MVFSSPLFLFFFLPVVWTLAIVAPRAVRNPLLFCASLLFYAWGETVFAVLLLVSIGTNYGLALWIDRARHTSGGSLPLILAIVINLGLLAWFKYAGFLAESLNGLLTGEATGPIPVPSVHLPLGISFFTFQVLSYVIDVHRAQAPVQRNPINLGLYVALFPQLIAGPIVRFHDIAAQISQREIQLAGLASGVRRFVVGLAKKVLVADVVGRVADEIFALPTQHLTPGLAWLGTLSFTIQIYFDFSGYSDMAIGLGRMLGFRFHENFDYPYMSQSLTEFWRRWHISLSTWFRDYLYVPLGGNRRGALRTYVNLSVVFLLCGLWHGASWNFVLWGAYHGIFLVLERPARGKLQPRRWSPLRSAYVLAVVSIGWVLFRSSSMTQALAFLAALVGHASGDGTLHSVAMYTESRLLIALAAGIAGSGPLVPSLVNLWRRWCAASSVRAGTLLDATGRCVGVAGLAALFWLSAIHVAATTYVPFIYFRF